MKRNHGSWKRWVSGLLAAAMLLGVLPFAALAEETLPAQTAAMEEQTAPTSEAAEEPTEAAEEPTEAAEEPTEATEAPTETTEEPAGEVLVPLSDPAAPWDTDGDGVLEILAIGNSFSVDALEYAYRIAADLGIESIALGNLYIGGCSLATHVANANGDKGAYTYYYNDSGSWTTTKSYKISMALADRTWDYVTLQQRSPDSGLESTYNEDLTDLIAYVKERSDAKLAWHMTWAYQGDSTHSGFANYGNDQLTMYNGIVTAAQNRILTNGAFSFVIPCGTAVQNSRTSLLGDTTTRDGYHMSYAYGRYLTGLMYIRTLTGLDISGISYVPSGVDDQQKAIAIESVNNAAKTAFAVTQSRYTLQEPGEGYARLELQLTKGAFWHPSVGTDLFFDKSNSNQFFATAKFTREQLPVGSVILLESGWQYRPDGWVTEELQTGTREETTTRNYILVTEDWWKDYTIRSFNLSKVGNPSLEAVDPETANEALRIFVPEAKEEAPISFPGKKVSILSHSASTYAGVSNDTSANSTIGNNDVYYTQGRHGVYRKDTWWQQAMDALGMELLVNNSWSGSCIFQPRKGAASVGYGDRAVNLHNDHTGEEPEIIWVYLGCNDFAYFQDSFGKAADVNYAALIQENNDGSVSYAAPTTACEAYAIMLHKIRTRYPQAKIYCMTSTARRDPDYSGDSYPDVGQPTAFVAQLHQIARHFGCPVIDLEQVIPKDAAIFDTLMGDKRAHPNALGMDRITNALLSVMLGTQAEIRHVTSEDATVKEQAVLLGGSYSAKAALREGESAVVIMNGEDITAQAFRDGQITIPKVTGDIEITTALRQTSLNFRWEMQENAIVSTGEGENTPTRVTGTVTEGMLQNGHYRLDTPVILRHDYNWELQWQFSGNWRGIMLASQTAMEPGALYLSRTKGGQLCFGTMEGTKYHNYGVDLSTLDAQMHTFRLSNRVAADGSNMVWLSLDGAEAVPMNRFFLGSADQNRTSDWISGRDFVLPCLGTEDYPLNDCGVSYLEAREGSHVHSWNGNQCTTCGETAKALPLRYDDHYDITGKTVEIIDAGKPTSYQVGYGLEENTVPDAAVVELQGDYLVAAGIGKAIVTIDGQHYEIAVTAAPINLLLLIGQSNMEGMVGNENQSIACPDGQVYATYGKANGLTGDAGLTVENAGNHVASALRGEHSMVNINGNETKLSGFPINSLTASGKGKYGMDSGIAYEWNRRTGEKVWVINAAHGASSIQSWQKGESNYQEARALFTACLQVLQKEIAAGHYRLSHMGYYWCQGCADETQTAQWYVQRYLAMHESLKAEFVFDHDQNEATPERGLEFGNIVLVMAGHENAVGYRKGVYTDESAQFFATFKELEMRGPRVAQIWMANNPQLQDIHIVSTLAQDWVTMPDGSNGVAAYFAEHYTGGVVDYPTQVKQSASWYAPTTPAAVKNSIHYYQLGYNEVGREAARNTLYILGEAEKPVVETRVSFVNWTGYEKAERIKGSAAASCQSLVVPVVSPCYESKTVTYTVSEGLEYNYYDLVDTGVDGGTLTASLGPKVEVTGRTYAAYHFELADGELVSVQKDTFQENTLTANGSIHTYTLAEPIVLKHDKPWVVEFNSVADPRFMALASSKGATEGMWYFFKSQSGSGVLAMGEYKDGLYQNYGLLQSEIDVDWTQSHSYRFCNVVNPDGTNRIHIFIDGNEVGTATNQIIDGTVKSRENDYLSGKDFTFSHIGCGGFGLGAGQMTCLTVWEDTHTHDYTTVVTAPTCTEQGFTTHRCSICGKTYRDTYVDAKGHTWLDAGAGIRECTVCGHIEGGYRIEAPAAEVWIDGVKYAAREDKNGKFVQLERTDAKTLVTYSYNDAEASAPHTQYPTLMQVWRLTFENGAYKLAYMPEWEDLLQYAGSSIRVTGVKGIRVITGIPKALRSKLLDGSLGYTLVEYGTAVTWAADGIPMLGQGHTMFNFAYRQGVADPIFADTGSTIQYTNVLVGFTDDQLGKDLIMRPYMILEDAAGERITLYGGCVQRSVGYIAKQNQNTFPEGSKADTYIEDIISKVYG